LVKSNWPEYTFRIAIKEGLRPQLPRSLIGMWNFVLRLSMLDCLKGC
jgi:hypothetical protein